jgi:hypothetical protein
MHQVIMDRLRQIEGDQDYGAAGVANLSATTQYQPLKYR